jgi:hypothetical protein
LSLALVIFTVHHYHQVRRQVGQSRKAGLTQPEVCASINELLLAVNSTKQLSNTQFSSIVNAAHPSRKKKTIVADIVVRQQVSVWATSINNNSSSSSSSNNDSAEVAMDTC